MQSSLPSYSQKGDLDSHILQNQLNQALPTGPGGPQVLYACPAPQTSNIYEKYKGSQSVFNGAVQIVIGLLCISFNAAAINLGLDNYYQLLDIVGYGIWGGVLFLIAGSIGIAAGKQRSKCLIIAFMVLCIISCAVCIVIFSLSIINILISQPEGYYAQMAMNIMLLVLSVAEAAFGIWGSISCCAAACCGAPTMQYYTTSPNQFNQQNARIIVVDNLQALNPNMLQQGYPTTVLSH